MITVQTRIWTEYNGWSEPSIQLSEKPQLIFVFGSRRLVERADLCEELKQFYPDTIILISSTAGNILEDSVTDEIVTVSAIHFEKTKIRYSIVNIADSDSKSVGQKLVESLPTEDLLHAFVLSEGLDVNGSELAQSINDSLPPTVAVTGGLAGDGDIFKRTVVGLNDIPKKDQVALVGFYGKNLRIGHSSEGGWLATPGSLTITKSEGNVLYELNNRPALDVYKGMMGELAAQLPGAGSLYPLQLEIPGKGTVVRTVSAVDDKKRSITFAGDMPEGIVANLMHAEEADLIESAGLAARKGVETLGDVPAQFAILVSCFGRRLVLQDRTIEEIRSVRESLGNQTVIHGFYSYGELSPDKNTDRICLLHNQTMTITTFAET